MLDESVDDLPVRYLQPATEPRGAVLWLSHLGGSAEQTVPMLQRLAARGLVAVTFYAQWFYDRLDPLSHWQRFRRDLRVQFLCGADDQHVPPEAAHRFMELVNGDDADPIVTVRDEPGLDHIGMVGSDAAYDQAADWLARLGFT